MRRVPLFVSLTVIFVVGAIAASWPVLWPRPSGVTSERIVRFSESLGEALMIAAILGVVVDRYTKMKLATEVGETIAEKIHGYYLPEALREAINKVNDFKFVWSEVVWNIRMSPVPGQPGCLRWRSTLSYDVVNITPVEQYFVHKARLRTGSSFPNGANAPRIAEVAYYLDGVKQYAYTENDAEFKSGYTATPSELCWQGKDEIPIPARQKRDTGPGQRHRIFNTIERNVDENDMRSLLFSFPAINGVTLRVYCPEGFEILTSLDSDGIKASAPPDGTPGVEWRARGVFLNNQRIALRHRRAPIAACGTSPSIGEPANGKR
jgi:hypothetical protein